MRRLPAVLAVLVAAAIVLLATPVPAAPTSRVFKVLTDPVRAGQEVKTYGRGCGGRAAVRLYIDGIPMASARADRLGRFVAHVEMPVTADLGRHRMKAVCSGRGPGTDTVNVLRSRFNISPRVLEAGGDELTAAGSLCPARALVSVAIDGRTIGYARAAGNGRFRKTKRLSSATSEGRHVISSRCGGRLVGAMSLRVLDAYPAPSSSLLTTDRSRVPAAMQRAAAAQPFGLRQDPGAAISFGLLAGIALLAASVAVARRRS